MIENLPYINEQSFDYNNINNFSFKKQNLMQDNYLNQNLYQELHQPPIIYKEDQQNINYYEGIPLQLKKDNSELNNNMLPINIQLKIKGDNTNENYNNITNQNNQIILKLSKYIKDSQDSLISQNWSKDSDTTNSDISRHNNSKVKNSQKRNADINNLMSINKMKKFDDFSPDSWKNFYDNDDTFFILEDEGYSPIVKTTIITNQENPNMSGTYTGDINSEGEMHGFGQLVSPNVTRIGSWSHNKFTGWGRKKYKNGEMYEGKFINGKLNGKGIYKDDYSLYIGDFKKSVKHGYGELFTDDFHYVGNFNNDKLDGRGRIEIYGKGIYEGNFNKEQINGYGVFKYCNGDYYEGEMKNGEMDGYGILKCANGNSHEGYFKEGRFLG